MFENFPYSNFHELNLDYILNKLDKLEKRVANISSESSDEAIRKANEALRKAETAQSTANNADAKAETSQSTANIADAKAETAQSTANIADAKAETAQSTANIADAKAETAQSTANIADAKAETNKTDIQNAKKVSGNTTHTLLNNFSGTVHINYTGQLVTVSGRLTIPKDFTSWSSEIFLNSLPSAVQDTACGFIVSDNSNIIGVVYITTNGDISIQGRGGQTIAGATGYFTATYIKSE